MTFKAHKSFIERLDLGSDFVTESFFSSISQPVNIAIAISGGGYRSMLTAAGAIQAFDIRTPNSTRKGQLGGLLQATSYISTVSGGSWLLSSLLINDFESVYSLKQNKNVWNFQRPLLEGIPQIDFDKEKEKFSKKNDDTSFAKRDINDVMSSIDNVRDSFILNDLIQEFDEIFDTGISGDSTINKVLNISKDSEFDNHQQTVFDVELDNNSITQDKLNDSIKNHQFMRNTTLVEEIFNFYQNLNLQVRPKKFSGFRITLTDFWARALARIIYHSSNPNNSHSSAQAVNSQSVIPLSSIIEKQAFKNFQMPFPIILSNLRWPKIKATSIDSQVVEISPFEFGSWDYYLNAFMQTKFLGSALYNGKPIFQDREQKDSICIAGFDDISYIAATSSSLFNNVLIYIWQLVSSTKKKTSEAMKIILFTFGLSLESNDPSQNHPDYAVFSPNPFYGYTDSNADTKIIDSPNLFLVDGGEDKQNIPFFPLLQKARNVDIIFAIDSTADFRNYPNGTSLWATFNRYVQNRKLYNTSSVPILSKGSNASESKLYNIFPKIPNPEEILNLKMYEKPIFLGCDLGNSYGLRKENISQTKINNDYLTKKKNSWLPPLIVYHPNSHQTYHSNTSTFKLTYNQEELNGMLINGANIVTYSNSSKVEYYDKCVGCATLKREFDRIELGMNNKFDLEQFKIPEICNKCFAEFCYS